MNVRLLASALFLFSLLPYAFSVAASEDDKTASSLRNLEILDTFKIKSVRSPSLSPDGKLLAYTVTTRNYEKNRSKTRIWMMPTKGGDPIPMTAEAVSSRAPTFSLDGKGSTLSRRATMVNLRFGSSILSTAAKPSN